MNEIYNEAIQDAIDVVQEARACGEGDMRQVIFWLRDLIKQEEQ